MRAFAGATVGAVMAALLTIIENPTADLLALMDESLALLEAGLPL